MKSIIKNIIIIVLSAAAVSMGIWLMLICGGNTDTAYSWKECVRDKGAAIKLAQAVYKVYSGEDFEYEDFEACEGDDSWQVWLKHYDTPKEQYSAYCAGIYINKKTGALNTMLFGGENEIEEFHRYKESKK